MEMLGVSTMIDMVTATLPLVAFPVIVSPVIAFWDSF
jgi:hypothetical protein